MKHDIILCGVGGQGILLLSNLLIMVAESMKCHVKQSEIHGMSQRGGAVSANLRISSEEIFSPLIPKGSATLIISMEPLETFRYMDYANNQTKIIVNKEPVTNIKNYPDLDMVLNNLKNVGANILTGANNLVLAGTASKLMGIDLEVFKESLKKLFSSKDNSILEKGLEDLRKGQNYWG